jgi:hypothetical protein
MTYGPHGMVAKSQHVILPLSQPEPLHEPLPWRNAESATTNDAKSGESPPATTPLSQLRIGCEPCRTISRGGWTLSPATTARCITRGEVVFHARRQLFPALGIPNTARRERALGLVRGP